MKEGFVVGNECIVKSDNCVLVDNYVDLNLISNIPLNLKQLNENKDKNSIGVWKIKSLKN